MRRIHDDVHYARDAFDGLTLMGEITQRVAPQREATSVARISDDQVVPVAADVALLERYVEETEQRFGLRSAEVEAESRTAMAPTPEHETVPPSAPLPRSDIGHEHPVPRPPFWGSRVLPEIDLNDALAYVNEVMLFQVQWGYRKKGRSPKEWQEYIANEIRPRYNDLIEQCHREDIIQLQAAYGYWPANSQGDDLVIFEPPSGTIDRPEHHGRELARFTFPRQHKAPYWCLADFWRPLAAGVPDVAAFSIVTAGRRVSDVARQWFAEDKYLQYLLLHGVGVEAAEALAELIHKRIRTELGVASQDARDLQKLFKQGYQGSRYSLGYPACPNLADQTLFMKLLEPERIGIELSEEYQLHPEQSTSALITYHPEARYFNAQ